MIHIDGLQYQLVTDYKDGWNAEAFQERYSEVLNKYDYIVGDWGYGQLRLRGFYSDDRKKTPLDTRISFIDEYLQEYCNFGCSYFILQKENDQKEEENANESEILSEIRK